MIEVIQQINAVRRRVGSRVLDAGEAHSDADVAAGADETAAQAAADRTTSAYTGTPGEH
jgi:hypothetical protein